MRFTQQIDKKDVSIVWVEGAVVHVRLNAEETSSKEKVSQKKAHHVARRIWKKIKPMGPEDREKALREWLGT